MVHEANSLEFFMRSTGGTTVAAEFDRVSKAIDSTALSSDRTAVAVENLDRTLLAIAGAMDKEIAAASRSSTANKALGDSFKFVAVSSEQSVAGVNAATAALERNAMAATAASGKMRTFAGSATATGLIKASKWIAGGALVTGYESIKKYMSFQRIVTQSVTEAGVPLKDQKTAMAGLLDISKQTGAKADDLAHIYYRVASSLAGTHTPLQRMLDLSKQIANLNLLGNVPSGQQSEDTARVFMSVYNANLKDTGHNTKKIIGTASAIAGSADAYIKDVSVAYGNGLLAAAQQQGLGMNEAGAIFAAYTKLGMKPASAGVYATRAITQLFSPTVAGTKGFAALGIDPFMLKKKLDTKGFGGVLKYINDALAGPLNPLPTYAKYKGKTGSAAAFAQLDTWFNGSLNATFKNALGQNVTGAAFKAQLAANLKSGKGMTERDMSVVRNMMLTRMFGGQRGSVQVAALLNNLPSFMAAFENINKNTSNARVNRLTKIARETPAAQLKIVQAKINADFIKIGEIVTPIFLKMARAFATFFDVFSKFKIVIWEVVGVLGEVLLLGIAFKSLRGLIRIFDFFKKMSTTKLKDAITNTKTTETMVASGTTMERAAGVEMQAARLQLRAAEVSSLKGKGLYVPGHSYPSRAPYGVYGVAGASASSAGKPYVTRTPVSIINQGAKARMAQPIPFFPRGAAASTTVATAERAGIGATLRGGASALGGFMMGAPGMIAMMALPLILPMIPSIVKGIGSIFGSGPQAPLITAATQATVKTKSKTELTAAQKALAAASKGDSNSIFQYAKNAVRGNRDLARASFDPKNKWIANNFAHLYQTTDQTKQNAAKLMKMFPGTKTYQDAFNRANAQEQKLMGQIRKDPKFAAYMQKVRPLLMAQMGFIDPGGFSKSNAIAQETAKMYSKQATAFLKTSTLQKIGGGATTRVISDLQGIATLSAAQKREAALARDAKLPRQVRESYAFQAAELGTQIAKLKANLAKDTSGKTGQKLDAKTINDWAKAAAKEQKANFDAAGLTADKIGKAVADAVNGLPGKDHWKN